MDVDVTISVHTTKTPDEMQDRIRRLRWHLGARHIMDTGDEFGVYAHTNQDGTQEALEFHFLDRFYGPGYERGYWPTIYAIIRQFQHAFPECEIEYHGDCSEGGPVVTDALLAELWTHWVENGHSPYRDYTGPECCGGRVYPSTSSGGRSWGTCNVCGSQREC